MRSLAADDHPHPRRPARQRHQPGCFDDPGAGAGFAVGVVGGLPVAGGQRGELVDQRLGQAEPDRVRQPLGVQPVQQFMGGSGAVDPDQDLPAGPMPAPVAG